MDAPTINITQEQAEAVAKRVNIMGNDHTIKYLRILHDHYLRIVDDVQICTFNDCLWLMCIKKEITAIKKKYGTGCPEKIAEMQKKEKKDAGK